MISILMGLYNCEATLDEALNSLCVQTVQDWEIIACDDGSTDGTWETAMRWKNALGDRLLLLRNAENHGLSYTLNRCLMCAHGDFLARMDADDICEPTRLEREIRTLAAEPQIAFVSTAMTCFDEQGIWGMVRHSEAPKPCDFLFGNPFCHAPCMMRKDALLSVGGYAERKGVQRVEDYDLWVRMYAAGLRGKNLPEPLYRVRDDRAAAGRRKFRDRRREAAVMLSAVWRLGLPKITGLAALRPLAVGLLPPPVYLRLHRRKWRREAAL